MRIVLLFILGGLGSLFTVQNVSAQSKISITGAVKKSYNGSDISCYGVNDGEITVSASGGSGHYEYSKDNGNTYQSGNVLTGLPGGANCVIKVRDSRNTENVSSAKYVWVGSVNAVHINTFQRSTYYNDGSDGVSCVYNSDGAILLKADGGSGAFSYSLDNGATFQSDTHFTGLAAGTYNAMVKDANGCYTTSTSPVTLAAPAPIVAVVHSQTNISCSAPTGSIVVSGSGGNGNYQVSIDAGNTFSYLAKGSSHSFTNLAAGDYTIMVKDGNYSTGCYGTADVKITALLDTATINGDATLNACTGNSARFNLNIASTGSGQYTAVYQDNSGNTFTTRHLVAGDNTITTGTLTQSTVYSLVSVTSQTGCSASVSGSAHITVADPGTWKGSSNSWNDSGNWSCGAIPTSSTNVTIPNTANNPVVPAGISSVNNLTIAIGATLTVQGTLQIAGTVTNHGTLDVTAGTLEFNGNAAQTISGSLFVDRTVDNLKISNTHGLSLSSTDNDTLNIKGTLSFGVSDATFNTHGNLTLKSTAEGTAQVADLTNNGANKGNSIVGNVEVERYINVGPLSAQHNKSWVMLATPTNGQTIQQAWMEGGNKSATGYGTQISGNGTGFDVYSATPALKYYDDQNNTWTGVTNTTTPIFNQQGYMLFVRGDRSLTYPNYNNTTLRTKGTLLTGTQAAVNVKAGKFQSVGNPYAADVDLRKLTMTGLNPDIIVWDPSLTIGSSYGLGAYQVLYKSGENYVNLLSSPDYGPAGTINNNIASGVAFFVQSDGDQGQVIFTEKSKASQAASHIVLREQTAADSTIRLSSSLYGISSSGTTFITDGTLQLFSKAFSDSVDGMDTKKLSNTSENLSVRTAGEDLVIERRNLPVSGDTITYNLSGIHNQNYRLVFDASGLQSAGVQGFVEDAYTNTETPLALNGTTQVDFTISNAAASKASNRFHIAFRTMEAMPVTFTSIKATAGIGNIALDWEVENQSNLKEYDVEKSADGLDFSPVAVVKANNNVSSAYSFLDQQPYSGANFYRIRSVDLNGTISYTSIVKVEMSQLSAMTIKAFPNPAISPMVNLQLDNAAEGIYYVKVLNPLGQVISTKKIVHLKGSSLETINWNPASPHGIYQVEVILPDGKSKTLPVKY